MIMHLPNLGLVQRSLREVVGLTLAMSGVVFAISALFSYAMPRIQARFERRNFIPPQVRQFRDALFGGVDSTGAQTAEIAFAIAWSHPIVLIPIFAHAILVNTRVPAAEIERGTVDVLLALPVSRLSLLCSETVAWLVTALTVLGAVFAGSYFGAQFIDPQFRPDWSRLLLVLLNLGAVYAVVGAMAILLTTLLDRRAWAVIIVLVATVFSLLINFLHTLDPALEFTKRLRFLSFLEYYKPLRAMMDGRPPWQDVAILAGVAMALWTAAAVHFVRRDVTTT